MNASSFREVGPASARAPWLGIVQSPLYRVLNHVTLVARHAVNCKVAETRFFTSETDNNPAVATIPELEEINLNPRLWLPARTDFCHEAHHTVRLGHPFCPQGLIGSAPDSSLARETSLNLLCLVGEVTGEQWYLMTFAREAGSDFSSEEREIFTHYAAAAGEQIADVVAPPERRIFRKLDNLGNNYNFTETESKVAALLIGSTLSEQAIAGELHRSFNTIHRHVTNIYRKLGVRSRLEAMAAIVQQSNGNMLANNHQENHYST